MNKEEIIKMQIKRVEKEIRDTPYDKSSEHHHGVLKAKLSKLKDELYGVQAGSGGGGVSYAIKHSGDATAVLVGLPSVGKSTLLNRLTNAESKVGNYDFTTLGVVPGMMEYKGVKIQILDLPGIGEGAAKNRGFGKKVLSVIRASNMVILVSDAERVDWFSKVEAELFEAGVRFNQDKPRIHYRKSERGGIRIVNPHGGLTDDVIESVCKEMGISNASLQFEERVTAVDRLIDVLTKSRVYLPLVKVINKIDSAKAYQIDEECVAISARQNWGLDVLKEEIWKKLGLVRVFLKRDRNGDTDKKKPLVVGNTRTLEDVVKKISAEMRQDVKSAYIWGHGAKFAGQRVSLNFRVFDGMEVWFGR